MSLVIFQPKLDYIVCGKSWVLINTCLAIIDSIEKVVKNAVHILKVKGCSEGEDSCVMSTEQDHFRRLLFLLQIILDPLLHIVEDRFKEL